MDKDLKLVEMVKDHLRRMGRNYETLQSLNHLLHDRSDALAALHQTGTPQVMKVLLLVLREIWETRITDGTSKLAEQPTSTLQHLCKLLQTAMEDFKWKNGVRKDKWCVYFCGPLWALRDSRGRGPSEWPDFDEALEDLEVIFTEAQSILSSRLPAETAEELQQMKSANESLKLQVVQMEEKFEKLLQDTLKFREVFDSQKKMEVELAELKLDNSKMKKVLTDLKSDNHRLKGNEAEFDQNVRQLEQDVLNVKELNEKQQGELLATKEELRQLKEELQEWKVEKESLKSQGLEADRKVIQLEESNTMLSKQLHEQLQKLEDERLIMKEDRLKMKEQVIELKIQMNQEKSKLEDELQELSSNYGHLKQLKLKAIKADVSDVCSELSSWVQGHQDAESSMLHSASSAFSIANGPRCFMLDAVFKTPRETFIDGTHLCLGL